MKVYIIVNRETGEIFQNAVFNSPNGAASSFNYYAKWQRPRVPKLQDQDVWVRRVAEIDPEVLPDV